MEELETKIGKIKVSKNRKLFLTCTLTFASIIYGDYFIAKPSLASGIFWGMIIVSNVYQGASFYKTNKEYKKMLKKF